MSQPEISADELRRVVAALGLVPVPDHLMERVLKSVREHRAAMRRLEQSDVALHDVLTAQPYRV